MDHYQALGVSRADEVAVIRRAYLAAARRYHPDFHADADAPVRADNARRMQRLNEAWSVLGDPNARSAYDLHLDRMADPGIARRAAREAGVAAPPAGKGWTPRAGDDGWMEDFDAWAAEGDELAPDVPRSTARRLTTMLPVGLFALAVACAALGVVLSVRPLVAAGAIAFALSVGLMVLLPIVEMTRGRR